MSETIDEMHHYGFTYPRADDVTFDWEYLKHARDSYIDRLNNLYGQNLNSSNVVRIKGLSSLQIENDCSIPCDISLMETLQPPGLLIAVMVVIKV